MTVCLCWGRAGQVNDDDDDVKERKKGKCALAMDDREARARARSWLLCCYVVFFGDHPPIGPAAGVPGDIYIVRSYIFLYVG